MANHNNSDTRTPPRRNWSALLSVVMGLVAFSAVSSSALAQVPAVDRYRLTAVPAAGSMITVTALPGSVAPTAMVYVTNVRTWEMAPAIAPAPDGSFTTQLGGVRNDRLSVYAMDPSGNTSLITLIYAGALTIKNPYRPGAYWRVGQAHTHTTHSDGVDSPAALEAAYQQNGYDFIISTDHRGISPNFMAADDGLTPDPDNTAAGRDLFWVSGAEIGNNLIHMGSWGTSSYVTFTDVLDTQRAIDATRALGGIAVINHPENPSAGYAWDWHDEIVPVRNVSLIEAFNGKPRGEDQVIPQHVLDAVDLADEFQQVWWIGADDCHDVNRPEEFNRYAIVVQADVASIAQADLLAAADAGRLYIRETAQGPAISAVAVSGNTVELTLADISSAYEVAWYKRGSELAERDLAVDTVASYIVQGSEGYIRAEVTRLSDGRKAYTQPLFIANNRDLAVSANVAALVDNDSTTAWDAGAATGSFVIDAGSVRNLNAIRIDWDGAGGRRFNYEVEVSDTGEFAGEQRPVVRRTYSNRLALTLDFFDARSRYVRVLIDGQSVGTGATARVREVELFDATPARGNLYIDNVNGDDDHSGLVGSPWRTFNFARERVRPRDTLNFIQTAVPYAAPMQLLDKYGGKHQGATVQYRGASGVAARIDASGQEFGVTLQGVQWVEWTDFDISLATRADLFIDGGANNVIQRNRLHSSQGRGLLGSGDFTAAYNLIYDNATDGVSLYVDGTSARIYNNVLYGNGVDGLAIHNVGTISATVRNNISAGNGRAGFWREFNSLVTDSHNCSPDPYFGYWYKTGSIAADPKFTGPPSRDFPLQLTSPCIDAGIDLNYNADFDGEPIRDVLSRPDTGSPGAYSRTYTDIGAHEACDTCTAGGGGCHQ